MSSLLPASHSDFNTKQYWDNFFLKRGNKAFEWYGTFDNVSSFVTRKISNDKKFLIIGCGNSDFSANLYDANYKNITNLDFSEPVINEMIRKNKKRDKMKWIVDDMTDMKKVETNSIDIVFDKGALDALLSEDTFDTKLKTKMMFHEIDRILISTGQYICITLAQDFVIKTLLEYFSSDNNYNTTTTISGNYIWKITIHAITTSTPSPFIPFYIILEKSSKINSSNVLNNIQICVNSFGQSIDEKESIHMNKDQTLKLISSIQEYQEHSFNLREFKEHRFESIDYWSPQNTSSPRFTLTILDNTTLLNPSRLCAVFILPVGRESEYQFSTMRGLLEIANQADCKRLIAVRLNKPHVFPMMSELQLELNPIIMTLIPYNYNPEKESVPYMALSTESEWKEVRYDYSIISGDYIIEEKVYIDEDEDDDSADDKGEDDSAADEKEVKDKDNECHRIKLSETEKVTLKNKKKELLQGAILRRLIFVQNQGFIQTESRLLRHSVPTITSADNSASTTNTTLTTMEIKEVVPSYYFDMSYIDKHHLAMISSLILSPTFLLSQYESITHIKGKKTHLSNTTTTTMTTTNATTLSSNSLSTSGIDTTSAVPPPLGIVIGLGGGSLIMALQYYYPFHTILVCELDNIIETIANQYFGLQINEKSTYIIIDEGIQFLTSLQHYFTQSHNSSEDLSRDIKSIEIHSNPNTQKKSKSIDTILPILSQYTTTTTTTAAVTTSPQDMVNSNTSTSSSSSSSSTSHSTKGLPITPVSYLIIDVDGKDTSLKLTAPPETFITLSSLFLMYSLLMPGGLLILNVVARGGEEPVHQLIQSLQTVFCPHKSTTIATTTTTEVSQDKSSSSLSLSSSANDNNNNNHNDNNNNNNNNNNNDNTIYEDGYIYTIKPSEDTVNMIIIAVKGVLRKKQQQLSTTQTIIDQKGTSLASTTITTPILGSTNSTNVTNISINDSSMNELSLDDNNSNDNIIDTNSTIVNSINNNSSSNNNNNKSKQNKKKKLKKLIKHQSQQDYTNKLISNIQNDRDYHMITTREQKQEILQIYLNTILQYYEKGSQRNSSHSTSGNQIITTYDLKKKISKYIKKLHRFN